MLELDVKKIADNTNKEIDSIVKALKTNFGNRKSLDVSEITSGDIFSGIYTNNILLDRDYLIDYLRTSTLNAMQVSTLNLLINPFNICMHSHYYSINLSEKDFKDDLIKKYDNEITGCGQCWEQVFRNFVDKKMPGFDDKIIWDSEAGLFSSLVEDINDMSQYALNLWNIYGNEDELLKIISSTEFEKNIDI